MFKQRLTYRGAIKIVFEAHQIKQHQMRNKQVFLEIQIASTWLQSLIKLINILVFIATESYHRKQNFMRSVDSRRVLCIMNRSR